jgi:hypothetical protein
MMLMVGSIKRQQLLVSCVTLGCHKIYKENYIELRSDRSCCMEQNVGLLKDDMSMN